MLMSTCILASATEWSWSNDGYPRKGRSKKQGGTISAVKYLWELTNGIIPKGYEPDHLCKDKRCINLDHIEIVTSKENNVRAHRKLTIDQVREIRIKLNSMTRSALAKEYGVTYMTIKLIQINQTWKGIV